MEKRYNILVVEDDPLWIFTLKEQLKEYGHVETSATLEDGIRKLSSRSYHIAFFDLDLEVKLGGLKLVEKAKELGIYSVILSAIDTTDIIKSGYQLGCMDYLVKPTNAQAIELIFKKYRAVENRDNIVSLIRTNFITKDPQTLESLEIINQVGLSDKSILITGESGTGKTLLAETIHKAIGKKNSSFVALNCSQFSETVIESELFGHVKGAFTGAIKDKMGLIEQSDGGTLFLDEVHSLSPRTQQKLLKALGEGIIFPVGSDRPRQVNFRIIAATCEDLAELISKKKFRRDLYYRIKTFEIYLKPLRERIDDIMPLIEYYISKKHRKIIIEDEVKNILLGHNWLANAREVEDLVENWHVQGVGIVTINELPKNFLNSSKNSSTKISINDEQFRVACEMGFKTYLDFIRDQLILKALDQSNGKQIEAARTLKISRSSMSKALVKIQGVPLELQ